MSWDLERLKKELWSTQIIVNSLVNQVQELNDMSISSSLTTNAAGSLRVASSTTLLDGKILNADDLNLFETVGTGTATFTNNKHDLSVTSGQYLIKTTKRFYPYFSGKTQVVEQTFDNFNLEANVTKRVGYFSSNAVAPYDSNKDGFWIENDGSTYRFMVQRNGTEVVSVPIASWDGYREIADYDWNDFTVIYWEFLWLGGAVLKLWLKRDTGFVLCHTYVHAGNSTDIMMLSPNQTSRYEIRSSTGTGNFRYICSQVATEGSINESGQTISIFDTTGIACNVVGTIYALLGVRKSVTYRTNVIQIVDIEMSQATLNDPGVLLLYINPTLSAPLTYSANSRFEYAQATTQTITAGTGRLIASITVGASGGGTSVMKDNFLAFLSQTIDNTMDEYVLAYMPTATNQTVYGSMTLKEY